MRERRRLRKNIRRREWSRLGIRNDRDTGRGGRGNRSLKGCRGVWEWSEGRRGKVHGDGMIESGISKAGGLRDRAEGSGRGKRRREEERYVVVFFSIS